MAIAGLAGCAGGVGERPASLTFDYLAPLAFDVAKVEVVEAYAQEVEKEAAAGSSGLDGVAMSDIDKGLRDIVAIAAGSWANNRFVAEGTQGTARITIGEVSVEETFLPGEGGLFGREAADRYAVLADVRLDILDGRGIPKAYATAQATRAETVSRDITLNDRFVVFTRIARALVEDLDGEMARNIERHLSRYRR